MEGVVAVCWSTWCRREGSVREREVAFVRGNKRWPASCGLEPRGRSCGALPCWERVLRGRPRSFREALGDWTCGSHRLVDFPQTGEQFCRWRDWKDRPQSPLTCLTLWLSKGFRSWLDGTSLLATELTRNSDWAPSWQTRQDLGVGKVALKIIRQWRGEKGCRCGVQIA